MDNVQTLRDLITANRAEPDAEREARIRDLRLTIQPDIENDPTPALADTVSLRYEQSMPTCSPSELTPAVVRAAFTEMGCLYVPGVVGSEEVEILRDAIENAQETFSQEERDPVWHKSTSVLKREEAMKLAGARNLAIACGGYLAVDSPRAMFLCSDMLQRHGLVDLARSYLGEAPAFSASKFILWRVPSVGPETGWHQDGRFLGDQHDIRSLNVWTALSDCGQGEDAPGMELVIEKLDYYVQSAEDSHFDWSVSDKQEDDFRKRVPVLAPRFKAGDMLLFDHWLLHRTWRMPGMASNRYAIESWLFAPSAFPGGRLPMTA